MCTSNIIDAVINMNNIRVNDTTFIAKQIEICHTYRSGGGGGVVAAAVAVVTLLMTTLLTIGMTDRSRRH
jgi:hypothetical protein